MVVNMATFKPRNLNELLALAESAASAQLNLGMRPEAAYRFGLLAAIFVALDLVPPAIISGFRTHQEQRQLRDIGRPTASRSLHTVGLAYDVDTTNPTFPTFAYMWKLLGGRDSRDFETNPHGGHLDFPVAGIEPDPSY